jgi:hypothetical protein
MHKEISLENWLEPDPNNLRLITQVSGEQWLARILHPRLSVKVPEDVRDLFEVARGALVYGYLYFPLYFLGVGELQRVAEAAVKAKCLELKMPPPPGTPRRYGPGFTKNLQFLAEQGIVDFEDWKVIRDNRDYVSHPEKMTIMWPDYAVMVLGVTEMKINALFP